MSEHASEEIVIPSHVDWVNPLKELIAKITNQDGEKLGFEALAHEQGIAIDRLLALVVSFDRFIEWIGNKEESPLNLALLMRDAGSARNALCEIGIELPDLYLVSESKRDKLISEWRAA